MKLDITLNPRDFNLMPETELEEIIQNVQMIISTYKMTVPMDRGFGVDAAMLDKPMAASQAQLSAEIANAVRIQEPRARVQKVFFDGDGNDGQLLPRVRVEIVEKNLRGGVF